MGSDVVDTATMKRALTGILGQERKLTYGRFKRLKGDALVAKLKNLDVDEDLPDAMAVPFDAFIEAWSPTAPWCRACKIAAIKPNPNNDGILIIQSGKLCPWCMRTVAIARPHNATFVSWVTGLPVCDTEHYDTTHSAVKIPISEQALDEVAPEAFKTAIASMMKTPITYGDFLIYVKKKGFTAFGLASGDPHVVHRAFVDNHFVNYYIDQPTHLESQIAAAVEFRDSEAGKDASASQGAVAPASPAPAVVMAASQPAAAAPTNTPTSVAAAPTAAALAPAAFGSPADPRETVRLGAWLSTRELEEVFRAVKPIYSTGYLSLLLFDIPKNLLDRQYYPDGDDGLMQRLHMLNFAGRLTDGKIPLWIFLRNALIKIASGPTINILEAVMLRLEQRTDM